MFERDERLWATRDATPTRARFRWEIASLEIVDPLFTHAMPSPTTVWSDSARRRSVCGIGRVPASRFPLEPERALERGLVVPRFVLKRRSVKKTPSHRRLSIFSTSVRAFARADALERPKSRVFAGPSRA